MIGPVFHVEMLLGSRRGRLALFCRIYALWLLVQFFWLYYEDVMAIAQGWGRPQFVALYIQLFLVQQFLLLLLVTPVFVAGVITDEKSRGTLEYLLTADLTAWEIVGGKFLGRLAQLGQLALMGLPLFCFVGVYADLGPPKMLAIVGTTGALLFGLGAISLLTSVWCRNTRDAVLCLYGLGIAGVLLIVEAKALRTALGATGGWLPLVDAATTLLESFNPLYVVNPIWSPDPSPPELTRRLLRALTAWGLVSAVCLGVATWRLRRAYQKQIEAAGRRKPARWWRARRAAVADEPIRWKERHVEGIAPLPWLRAVPRWLGMAVVAAATVWLPNWATLNEAGAIGMALLVALGGGVIVGIRCSGAITLERERQTWEALLLAPLTIRELVDGKLRGILGAALPYLLAYALPAIVMSLWRNGDSAVLLVFALGLLAVCLVMYFVGAVGIWCSAWLKNSWMSLLATLLIGYTGSVLLGFLTGPAFWVARALLALLFGLPLVLFELATKVSIKPLLALEPAVVWALCGASMVWIVRHAAERFLSSARMRIARLERTPRWKEGINCTIAIEQYLSQFENPRA